MQHRRARLATLVVLMCVLSSGCSAARREASPEATLADFAEALERGDLERAYALLSDDLRAHQSFEEFQKHIRDNAVETKDLSQALKKPSRTRVYAAVGLSEGRFVELEQKAGRFYVASPVIDFYSQASPRAALDSFVLAVERARWDVLLALMPDADREGLDPATLGKNLEGQSEELTRMVALLKASHDAPIEIVGDRATMAYGESFTARFVRENGVWKIEDPE